jgi:hypothetical protein
MASHTEETKLERVIERRRAVALSCHFREAEGQWITQIADRVGRARLTGGLFSR